MSQHLTNSKEIQLGSIAVTVREMSVLQVRTWLAELLNPQSQRDLVDEALFSDCSLSDLLRMTSLTREQVDVLRPSQLQEVIALCKELNPDFFAFMGRLVKPAAPTA